MSLCFLIGLTVLVLALSVAQHRRNRRGRLYVWVWVVTCLLPFAGILGTVLELVMTLGPASATQAEDRARWLSDGIAAAVLPTAIALLVFIPVLISTIVATVRSRRR